MIWLNKVLDFLRNKKTYIVMALTLGLVAVILVTPLTIASIPSWAWWALGALGLGSINSAVTTASAYDNKGKLSYAAMGAILVGCGLDAFNIQIPDVVFVGLNAIGLAGLKNALLALEGTWKTQTVQLQDAVTQANKLSGVGTVSDSAKSAYVSPTGPEKPTS